MTGKGFSIITNFGCPTNCWYCIWEKHPLKDVKTTYESTDWEYLWGYLGDNDIKKISISGGGDPFFQIEKNYLWWAKIIRICRRLNIRIDVHTSILPNDKFFLSQFDKIVYHCDPMKFYQLKDIIKEIPTEKRLVFVIDEILDPVFITQVADFCSANDIGLSFRELAMQYKSQGYKQVEDYISRDKSGRWKFIKQDDYNLYYMPNNTIAEKFIEGI